MIAPGSARSRSSPRARSSHCPQASRSPAAGVGGRAGGGELGPERDGLRLGGGVIGVGRIGRVGVSGVGQQVGAGGEVAGRGPDAVPGQQRGRVRLGPDQVERVVGGERGRVVGQFLEHARAVGGGAQRQLAPAAAAGRVGLAPPAVQQAGHPGDVGADRQPGPARLLVDAADQRRARPVAGGRTPGPADELVAYAEQQERHPLAGLKAENYCAHLFIMTARLGCTRRCRGLPDEGARRGTAGWLAVEVDVDVKVGWRWRWTWRWGGGGAEAGWRRGGMEAGRGGWRGGAKWLV